MILGQFFFFFLSLKSDMETFTAFLVSPQTIFLQLKLVLRQDNPIKTQDVTTLGLKYSNCALFLSLSPLPPPTEFI